MTSACQRWCWSILLLATLACARDRGQGFATLEDAQLEISLEARGDSDDAELSTDRGYTIALDHATVRVGRWELLEFAKRPSETDGHEHDDEEHDHGLDEDEHEHAARDAPQTFSVLVGLRFDRALSMIAHRAVRPDHYEASRELPRSLPERVLVELDRLELAGTISGAELGEEAAALLIDLPLETELVASFEPVAIDRDGPRSVQLSTVVSVSGTLLDGIDFVELAAGGRVLVDDPAAPVARELARTLGASEIRAELE